MTTLFMAVGCSDSDTKDDVTPPPTPGTETYNFSVAVSQISYGSVMVDVTPDNATATYYCGVVTKELFSTFASDEAFVVNDAAYLAKEADAAGIALKDYLEARLSVGTASKRVSELEQKTDYYAYCYGMTSDGTITSVLSKAEFTTIAPDPLNLTFEVAVSDIATKSAKVTVTPSNATNSFFYDVQPKETVDKFFSDDDQLVAELVKLYGLESSSDNLSKGEQSETITLPYSGAEYYVIVFGYDSTGLTTDVSKTVFKSTEQSGGGGETPATGYDAWIGTWNVTSTSSGVNNKPVTFEITITQKTAGASYNIAGWGITTSRTSSVVEAVYDAETSGIAIVNQQGFGPKSDDPTYTITLLGYEDGPITGNYSGLKGTMTGETTANLIGSELKLSDGSTVTVSGMDLFALNLTEGKFKHLDPAAGFTAKDYPVGPYTMTKTGGGVTPPPAGDLTFQLDVTAITATGCTISATPSNNTDTYFFDVQKKEVVDSFEGDGTALIAALVEAYGEDFVSLLSTGPDSFSPTTLDANTPYTVIAFGYDADGGATTGITTKSFTTSAGGTEPSDLTLTIAIDAATKIPGGVAATITASNTTDPYLPAFFLADEIEGMSDAEIIAYTEQMYGPYMPYLTTMGNYQTTAEDFAGSLACLPGADYYLVAFGYDGGATTGVTKAKFTAGAGPDAAGTTFTFKVEDVTATGATVTVDASKEPVAYMWDVLSVANYQSIGADKFGAYVESSIDEYEAEPYNRTVNQIILNLGAWYSGAEYSYSNLSSETAYIVYAVCVDLTGKVIGTPAISDPFTTLESVTSSAAVTIAFDKYYDGDEVVAAGGSAGAAGKAFVPTTYTPSADVEYWLSGVFTGDYVDPAKADDAMIISNLEKSFPTQRTLDPGETTMTMNWLCGWGTCTFFAVGVDAAGNYGPVARKLGQFSKSDVSPITDLTGAPAKPTKASYRSVPAIAASNLQFGMSTFYRPLDSNRVTRNFESLVDTRKNRAEVVLPETRSYVDLSAALNELLSLGSTARYTNSEAQSYKTAAAVSGESASKLLRSKLNAVPAPVYVPRK